MANMVLDMLEPKLRQVLSLGDCRERPMTAFVGLITDEPTKRIGAGLFEAPEQAKIWAPKDRILIVTAWRGMHILDRVTKLWYDTYYNAFMAARRGEDGQVLRALDELRRDLPDIDEVRAELLRTPMPEDKLDSMLEQCDLAEAEARSVVQELKEELEAGVIKQTTAVKRVFSQYYGGWAGWHNHSDR